MQGWIFGLCLIWLSVFAHSVHASRVARSPLAARRDASLAALIARQDPSSIETPKTINFSTPSNTTTCGTVSFHWTCSSSLHIPALTFNLSVTNVNVSQSAPLASGASVSTTFTPPPEVTPAQSPVPPAETNITYPNPVLASVGTLSWEAAVPQGWYIVTGVVSDPIANPDIIFSPSAQFYVQTGQDTSCLISSSTPSQTPAPSPPSNGTALPSSDADTTASSLHNSSSSRLSAGAIAGIAVGAGALAALAVFGAARTSVHLRREALKRRNESYLDFGSNSQLSMSAVRRTD